MAPRKHWRIFMETNPPTPDLSGAPATNWTRDSVSIDRKVKISGSIFWAIERYWKVSGLSKYHKLKYMKTALPEKYRSNKINKPFSLIWHLFPWNVFRFSLYGIDAKYKISRFFPTFAALNFNLWKRILSSPMNSELPTYSRLGIKDTNAGATTGTQWFDTKGEIIESYSPCWWRPDWKKN